MTERDESLADEVKRLKRERTHYSAMDTGVYLGAASAATLRAAVGPSENFREMVHEFALTFVIGMGAWSIFILAVVMCVNGLNVAMRVIK